MTCDDVCIILIMMAFLLLCAHAYEIGLLCMLRNDVLDVKYSGRGEVPRDDPTC